MLKSPEISVLMSVYEEPIEWLNVAINSILTQSFIDFEFIIINDAPNRNENRVLLKKYQLLDSRVIVVDNVCNIGLTKSLNVGLKMARGKYIARMDADDISLPNRFIKQYTYMENNPDIGVCGCFVETIGEKKEKWKYPEQHKDVFLFFHSPFAHPTVFIRKSVLTKNNLLYNEQLRYSQDFDLWERLYGNTQFANIPEFLFMYRINQMQVTRRHASEQFLISTSIKTRAFNSYCQQNSINLELCDPLSLDTIIKYKQVVRKKNILFDTKTFLYYLYRSVQVESYKVLLYLFLSGDFLNLQLVYTLKIVYSHLFTKRKNIPLSFE